MLFAVEGGGFFSSSASGYSKGLSLLLPGHRKEDKPMRVLPWNEYQLVDQEADLELQLASTKDRLSRRCSSFVCFGRTSAGLDASPSAKKGPAYQHHVQPTARAPEKDNDQTTGLDDNDKNARRDPLRSSLKKPSKNTEVSGEGTSESEAPADDGNDISGFGHADAGRRKVQWTDACGSELVEIREFEPSEVSDSDDESDGGGERTCSCAIM